ncbi:hypothetical protein AB0I60_21915 [Actinosynnema sp. NPDC050436]|uniref:hypothetical protein n=1 Tax=Actinosynnema sp. NPDC050436 TaxID=3155659 RepID=UPI0033D9CAA3
MEVESKLRLAVARLRERLTAARNHGHFEILRRTRGTRLEGPRLDGPRRRPAGHDDQ